MSRDSKDLVHIEDTNGICVSEIYPMTLNDVFATVYIN